MLSVCLCNIVLSLKLGGIDVVFNFDCCYVLVLILVLVLVLAEEPPDELPDPELTPEPEAIPNFRRSRRSTNFPLQKPPHTPIHPKMKSPCLACIRSRPR